MAGRGGGGGGQEARRRGLRLASPARDGGVDSGLGTCSPTSEDRGLASTLGVAEGVDWLEAVVERLQTVFVVRGERERRGGRRRSRRKVVQEEVGEERDGRTKEECRSATAGEKVQSLSSRQRIAQHAPTGDKDKHLATERDQTGKNLDLGSQESLRGVSKVRRVSLDKRRGSFGANRSSELRLQKAKAGAGGKRRSPEKAGQTREGERSQARCENSGHRKGSFQEQRPPSQKGSGPRKVLSEKSSQRGRRRKTEGGKSEEHRKDLQGGATTGQQNQESNVARKIPIHGERGKACRRSAQNDTFQAVDCCHDAGREDGEGVGSRGGAGRIQKYGGRSVSRASEHGRREKENGRRGSENGRRGSDQRGERRKRPKGARIHSSSSSSGEESEKHLELEVEGVGRGVDRESRRRSNEEVFESGNRLSPGDAYIRTRRDSTSPMWWDERFQGGTAVSSWRKSRRGSEVNAVLMRRQSLSYNNREQESEADLSRRYSYFLDFIDDLCSGATCSDPGRAGGASEESENQGWAGRRARQPSGQSRNPSSWATVKHRLVLSSELLNLGRECSCGHPEVAMQCRSNYPVIGPKEFLLLHSSCAQPTHKDSPDLWYRFLQL